MKNVVFVIFCIATILMSCSKSSDEVTGGDSAINIVVDPIIQTRATESDFEDNDQIGVSVIIESDNSIFVENSQMIYNGSSFVNDDLVWYENSSETSTVVAYYPYISGSETPTSFTINADQTVDGAYTQSDLMIASKSSVTPTSSAVTMSFAHSLSRVVIEIKNQSEQSISSVMMSGTYSTAILDINQIDIVADVTSATIDIKVPLWDDGTYKAIVVPQSVAPTFTVILADGTELSQSKSTVTFVSGGQYSAEILVATASIDVNLSGSIEDWVDGGEIPEIEAPEDNDEVSFEEFDGYFVYDGVSYNTITFDNGTTWMIENLCYLPKGYTPSSDPTVWSGVWYPYELDYDQMVIDGTVGISPDAKYVVSVTDDEGIKRLGYLYDIETALTGGVAISETNCYDFEGKQGICPPGWHIPTRNEYFDLVGLSNKNAFGEDGNQIYENALFYDESYGSAPIKKVNEGGFNYIFTGYRYAAGFENNVVNTTTRYQTTMLQSSNTTVSEWYGELALNYYMTSTCYQPNYSTTIDGNPWYNTQFFGLMSTFTSSLYPEGRLSLSYVSAHAGQALRCVKDSIYE